MDRRRGLPSVDRLLRSVADLPRALATREARRLVEAVRGGEPAPADWEQALRERVAAVTTPRLRRVINATGVVLHTNLGRAPLAPEVARAVAELAEGYSTLELDLERGERGERLQGVAGPLAELCGAEAALAVNNNAAATLLMLTGLAAGREVVVSRGELVEIGGSFRVPEVITAGGARLREVGTTNRTRVADYAAALGPETAAILRVHPSNFRVVGFTEQPDRAGLAALARDRGVLLLEDLGSGALVEGLGEPTVREVLGTGVDLVSFSGDKLLGGPQAGLLAGRADLVRRLRRHPLYRALRLDRLVLGALEATLRGYLAGRMPLAVELLRRDPDALRATAEAWAEALRARGLRAHAAPDLGYAGAGSRPGEGLPTTVVVVEVPDPDAAAARLRAGRPPVVARVREAAVRVDPRTVLPGEGEPLLDALVAACGPVAGA